MEAKEIATMERMWTEKSKDGLLLAYQMSMILGSIRKNFEVDDEELENLIAEYDKEENGTLTLDNYNKICEHFLLKK